MRVSILEKKRLRTARNGYGWSVGIRVLESWHDTKEYYTMETENLLHEIIKNCPLKRGDDRACDKEYCQWYENQHRQCLVVLYLRSVIKKGA
jgi:hypothetical protein